MECVRHETYCKHQPCVPISQLFIRFEMMCGGDIIPGLIFADDTLLFTSDRPGIKKSFDVLVRWCNEWGVKINVHKSGIMPLRQKIKRDDVQYLIDNDEILMVSQYKYLG